MRLKSLLFLVAAVLASLGAAAGPWPYDEHADAAAAVQQAISAARSDHRKVLLVFGANWCPDCRALDEAMTGSGQHLLDRSFDIVKIDVGNFDRNLALVNRFGNPIARGIPAVVVLGPDQRVVYSTRSGELANASHMTEHAILDFLSAQLAGTSNH